MAKLTDISTAITWTSFHICVVHGTIKKWPPVISLRKVHSGLTFGDEGFALMVGGKRLGAFEIEADGDNNHDHISIYFTVYPQEKCEGLG